MPDLRGGVAFLSDLPSFFWDSFFLAFCRARAVVDSTAVGTLVTCVEASCVMGGGYANCDALQFAVTCAPSGPSRISKLLFPCAIAVLV